jgi:hypothetical protein
MDINLEVFNLETDFFGDLHCSSRFTDMLCDAQAVSIQPLFRWSKI